MSAATGTLILAIAAIITSVAGIGGVIFVAGQRVSRQESDRERLLSCEGRTEELRNAVSALEVKMAIMWGFQLRRGAAESLEKGIADMNSPLRFHADVLRRLDPIRPALREYGKRNAALPPGDFLLGLEATFGDELLTSFCIPFKASHGACLLAAMQVALDVPEINLDFIVSDYVRPLQNIDDLEALTA